MMPKETMEIIGKYKEEISDLLSACFTATLEHPVMNNEWPNYARALFTSIQELEPNRRNSWVINRDEIESALMYMWVTYIDAYYRKKRDVALRTYLLRRSIWGLRDWVHRQWSILDHNPELPTQEGLQSVKAEDPNDLFKLDLKFLMYGTPIYPLSELTAYERYLVFLHYGEEKTILEVAKIVHKSRRTVGLHLKKTISKVRRLANDGEAQDSE